jgi:hypothetical protein
MDEEIKQLIRSSGLKIESFGHNPNNPAPQMSINCYVIWYRFGQEPWIKSEFRSHHKLLEHLYCSGEIERKAEEVRGAAEAICQDCGYYGRWEDMNLRHHGGRDCPYCGGELDEQ